MPDRSEGNMPVSGPSPSLRDPAQWGSPPALSRRLSLLVRASGFLLGMLVTALAAMLLFISISFSDRQIGADVSAFVASEYSRTLSMPEGVHLALLPWPSLQTGAANLSEPGKPDAFASWKKASFELDTLALLRHQLVIRHARVDGLTVRLARDAKGIWNASDLLAAGDGSAPFSVRLEGLALTHASVVTEDAVNGLALQWRDLELGTDAWLANRGGRVRLISQIVAPKLTAAGKLSVSARYRFGETLANCMLSGVQAHYVGDMGAVTATDVTLGLGSLEWKQDEWKLADVQFGGNGKLDARSVEWTAALLGATGGERLQARSASAQVKLHDADESGPAADLRVSFQDFVPDAKSGSTAKFDSSWQVRARDHGALGKLRGELRHDARAARLSLQKMTGELSLSHPALKGGNTLAALKGDASWLLSPSGNGTRGELNLDAMFGKDTMHATASIGTRDGASAPFVMARLDSRRFDADRILNADVPALTFPTAQRLRGWGLDAVLHAENLKLGGMQMAFFHVPVKVTDGRLELPDHELRLYGGKLNGSIVYDAPKQTLTLFEAMREVQLDALIKDTKMPFPLSGLTNATLDVRSQGATLQSLPEQAKGVLRVYAKDVRWQGVDLPHSMLALNTGKSPAGNTRPATPLKEVSAAFAIEGPALRVEKLTARSDEVSLAGAGEIRYAAGEMNLALNTRAGNDKALAELRGRRLPPLRVKGPLMRPMVQIDAASTAPQPAIASR